MLSKIKQLIDECFQDNQTEEAHEHGLELSTAVLLVEVAKSDMDIGGHELEKIREILTKTFHLSDEEIEQIMEDAHVQSSEALSLYDFTRVINDNCSGEERKGVIGLMWQVAHADGRIDKYEDYIIRKVADLLYVKHSDFIQMKHQGQ